MEFALQSLDLAKEEENETEQALSIRVLGLVYTDLGDFNKSSQYFFECLKIYESINDNEGISKAYNSIGYVFFEQSNYDKAWRSDV